MKTDNDIRIGKKTRNSVIIRLKFTTCYTFDQNIICVKTRFLQQSFKMLNCISLEQVEHVEES